MNWRGVTAGVLVVAAILSGWSAWRQRAEPVVQTIDPLRSDYVLTDFELTALSSEGSEAFTLRAPRLEQHPEDRTISIQTPLFLVPDSHGAHWEIRSQNALITADHDEIMLREDVQADGTDNNGSPVTMNTEQLNVFPEKRTASSQELVTVQQPGSTIQGRGLDVDLSSKRYVLHSEVETRYVPTRR